MIQFTSCLSFAFQSRRLVGRILGGSEVQRTTIEFVNHLDGFEATKNIKVRIVGSFVKFAGTLG